jgi:hypothetical protein
MMVAPQAPRDTLPPVVTLSPLRFSCRPLPPPTARTPASICEQARSWNQRRHTHLVKNRKTVAKTGCVRDTHVREPDSILS